jgi:WD40 repeat protein
VETGKLATGLADGHVSLHDVMGRLHSLRPDFGRLLLVADQFEELYTLCPDERVQRGFQDILFDAAFGGNGSGPALWLALTLRADFMGHALAYRPFADAMQKHDVKLGPMNPEEIGRVISKPAELQGRAFEAGLVERIVDDVGEKAGALPLLEFALTKLWEGQQEGWLTHDYYEKIGRVEGAVARHADAVFEQFDDAERARTRRVFVQLVQPGEGTEDTRRLAKHEELADDWDLVRQLADERLVTTGRDADGHQTAEVVHEALIRSWGRLVGWMKEDRRFRMWQERLRFAIRQWEDAGRDEGALLRGVPLAEAEQWRAERGDELTVSERDFVDAGKQQRSMNEAAETERRTRELTLIRRARNLLALVALISIGGFLTALWLRSQSEYNALRAQSLALASASRAALAAEDPELALSLAAEAYGNGEAPEEVELALAEAAYSPGPRAMISTTTAGAKVLSAGPDGRQVFIGTLDGHVDVWDIETGISRRFEVAPTGREVRALSLDSRGEWLLAATNDGHVAVWDLATQEEIRRTFFAGNEVQAGALHPDGRYALVATGRILRRIGLIPGEIDMEFVGHGQGIRTVALNPSGTLAATAGFDHSIIIWDPDSGKAIRRLDGHQDTVNAVAFSPDGRWLVSGAQWLDPSVRLWEVASGREIQYLQGHGNSVYQVAFSADGSQVISIDEDGLLMIWRRSDGRLERELRTDFALPALTMLADGRSIALAGLEASQVAIWEIERGSVLGHIRASASGLFSVAIDRKGKRVASGAADGSVRVHDLESGAMLHEFSGHHRLVPRIAFSADGMRLASAGGDGSVRIWDLTQDRLEHLIEAHSWEVWGLAIQGNTVITGGWDGLLRTWDIRSGEPIERWEVGSMIQALALHPDGQRLAIATSDGDIILWDLKVGREDARWSASESILVGLAFNQADSRLVSGSMAGEVSIWDIETSRQVLQLDRAGSVWDVGWADASNVAFAESDGSVSIWNLDRNRVTRRLTTEQGQVHSLAVAPDATWLAGGTAQGSISLWRLDLSTSQLLTWLLDHRRVRSLDCHQRGGFGLPPCRQDRIPDVRAALEALIEPVRQASSLGQAPILAQRPTPRVEGLDLQPAAAPGASTARGEKGSYVSSLEPGSVDRWQYQLPKRTFTDVLVRAKSSTTSTVYAPAGQQTPGPLDPWLEVRSADGQLLGENDDIVGTRETDAMMWSLHDSEADEILIDVGSHASASGGGYTLTLLSVPSGTTIDMQREITGTISAIDFTQDGQQAIFGTHEGRLVRQELSTGQIIDNCAIDDAPVTALRSGQDDKTALVGDRNGVTRQVEFVGCKTIREFKLASDSSVRTIDVDLDVNAAEVPNVVLSLSHMSIALWDLATGSSLGWLDGHADSPRQGLILPDHRRVVTMGYHSIRVWAIAQARELARFEMPDPDARSRALVEVWAAMALAPDGHTLAAAARTVDMRRRPAPNIRLLDLDSEEEQGRIPLTLGSAVRLAYLPDNRHLLVGTLEGRLSVFDTETRAEVLRFAGHDDEVTSLAVSPDGHLAISAAADGTLRYWDLSELLEPGE